MIIARVAGCTRVLGKAQGYRGLPVRDELIFDNAAGAPSHSMVTAWTPTPEELASLQAGANIEVRVFAHPHAHPPILVGVGKMPEEPVANLKAKP